MDYGLVAVISLSVSIIAVIIAYVDMRRRLKAEREFNKSMAKLVNTLREELELFRKCMHAAGFTKVKPAKEGEFSLSLLSKLANKKAANTSVET